jgi:hypothetical protein
MEEREKQIAEDRAQPYITNSLTKNIKNLTTLLIILTIILILLTALTLYKIFYP